MLLSEATCNAFKVHFFISLLFQKKGQVEINCCINQHYATQTVNMLKTQKSESEYHANRFWGWVCCNNQECVFTWLVGSSGQTEVIYSGRWRSYHYTQTVRRLKSLTGGNWIRVVTHSTSWSCRDGGLQTTHTHTHTHTREVRTSINLTLFIPETSSTNLD